MEIFLPDGFVAGRARTPMSRPSQAKRLSVQASGVYYPVLRHWTTGFAVSANDAPILKGVISLYDGANHLGEYLVSTHEVVGEEVIFQTKKSTGVVYSAPVGSEAETRSAP